MTSPRTEAGPATLVPEQPASRSRRMWWRRARIAGGATILALLIWRVGTGPFVEGLRMVDGWSLLAALTIGAVTTVCCAWRWNLVARGLGVDVPMRAAIPAYYRSQFLNTTLPGGVVGDVHRAVSHGRDSGDISAGVRSVAWERSAGQVVQIVVTVIALLLLPSPVRSSMPIIAAALVVLAVAIVLIGRALPQSGPSLWVRAVRTGASDLRQGLLAQRAWPGIVLTSAIVVAGYAAMFLVAARTAGLVTSPLRMLPLALLVLLAMAVPLNIGGWGPREGVAAAVFVMAGLTAAQGISTAVVYGVMALVASLPGAVVLLAAWLRRDPSVGAHG